MRVIAFVLVVLWSWPASAASLAEIVSRLRVECGARVISGYRNTMTPFGVKSCHASGQAVDMVGNYGCMYRILRNWPGGYTTDAARCKHIHISSCQREWGLRFQHRTC